MWKRSVSHPTKSVCVRPSCSLRSATTQNCPGGGWKVINYTFCMWNKVPASSLVIIYRCSLWRDVRKEVPGKSPLLLLVTGNHEQTSVARYHMRKQDRKEKLCICVFQVCAQRSASPGRLWVPAEWHLFVRRGSGLSFPCKTSSVASCQNAFLRRLFWVQMF